MCRDRDWVLIRWIEWIIPELGGRPRLLPVGQVRFLGCVLPLPPAAVPLPSTDADVVRLAADDDDWRLAEGAAFTDVDEPLPCSLGVLWTKRTCAILLGSCMFRPAMLIWRQHWHLHIQWKYLDPSSYNRAISFTEYLPLWCWVRWYRERTGRQSA